MKEIFIKVAQFVEKITNASMIDINMRCLVVKLIEL